MSATPCGSRFEPSRPSSARIYLYSTTAPGWLREATGWRASDGPSATGRPSIARPAVEEIEGELPLR